MGSACCGKSKDSPYVPEADIHRIKTSSVPPTYKNESTRVKSTRLLRESSAIVRFSKPGVTKNKPPIDGYLQEPLLPLKEALEPFDGKIDQLFHYIKEAEDKCHQPSEHGLTKDESAAIYIYTMHWGDGCLYDRLQTALESGDRSKVVPWFKYLKLLKTALDKLPDADMNIWQGTGFTNELSKKLPKSSQHYSSLTSCSPSSDVIKKHRQKDANSRSIYIIYEPKSGKVVTEYTVGKLKEVMIFPGTKLGVANVEIIDTKGSVHIHMVKMEHPAPIEKKLVPSGKHFVCPNKGCGNYCPNDHTGDHCHGFVILTHVCCHHCNPRETCDPRFTCDECGTLVCSIYKCYNCGRCYCIKHCFK